MVPGRRRPSPACRHRPLAYGRHAHRALRTAFVAIVVALALPVQVSAAIFTDTAGHWAEPAIERLAAGGFVAGYPDGSFRPDRPILRVEAAVLASRVLGLRGDGTLPYSDAHRIPGWAVPHVAAAGALMQGVPDPRGGPAFQGDRRLTRAELAVLVDRAHRRVLGAPPARRGSEGPRYRDGAAIPLWARDAAAALQAAGLLRGRPDGRFEPHAFATRAEFAAVLVRLLDARDGAAPGVPDPAGPYVLAYYARSGAGDRRALDSLAQGAGTVTMVAEVGFAVDGSGRVVGQPDPRLAAYARQAGIPVVAVIQNDLGSGFDRDLVHRLLTTPELSARAVEEIAALVERHGYAGINLDFENVPARDRHALTAFAEQAARALHARGRLFTVAVPARTADDPADGWSGAFDYPALGRIADYVVVMTYDEHWAGGEPGPVASLPWVTRAAAHAAAEIPADRLLLGIAAYGYAWPAGGSGWAFTARQAPALAGRYGTSVRWDDAHQVPYFAYRSAGVDHIAYFENSHSLRPKLALARSLQLAGTALWRLGYEESDLWPLLARYRRGETLTAGGR